MHALSAITTLFVALAAPALAAVSPTSPSANTVVPIGQDLTALWSADSTGQWTDMTVQLMTGDNFQMVPLAILSPRIDGTTETSHTWTVPNVTPTSQIYFLQFTRAGDVSTATWTTRFTIAAADGSTSQPTNSTTTSGQTVRWGIGQLIGADGQPIPSTGSNTNFDPNGGNAAPTPSVSGSAGGAGGAGLVTTISQPPSFAVSASVSPSPSPSPSPSASSSSQSVSASNSRSASPVAAAASSSRAAAGRIEAAGWVAAVAGLVGVAFV